MDYCKSFQQGVFVELMMLLYYNEPGLPLSICAVTTTRSILNSRFYAKKSWSFVALQSRTNSFSGVPVSKLFPGGKLFLSSTGGIICFPKSHCLSYTRRHFLTFVGDAIMIWAIRLLAPTQALLCCGFMPPQAERANSRTLRWQYDSSCSPWSRSVSLQYRAFLFHEWD